MGAHRICAGVLLFPGWLLLLAAGCGALTETPGAHRDGEELPPQVMADARTAAQSSNEFALDLYRQLRTEGGNLFFSPASISTALTMTSAGARGQTQQQNA